MRDPKGVLLMGLVLVFGFGVLVPCGAAEGLSLLQAIEKVEKETKMLVVKAASAGSYHQLITIGDGKTKVISVCKDSGELEVKEERDWTEKSKEISEKAKIACSAAATNAMKECDGELRSVKVNLDGGTVTFVVCVKSKKKGPLAAAVCGCTGRVGSVESTAEAAEACE